MSAPQGASCGPRLSGQVPEQSPPSTAAGQPRSRAAVEVRGSCVLPSSRSPVPPQRSSLPRVSPLRRHWCGRARHEGMDSLLVESGGGGACCSTAAGQGVLPGLACTVAAGHCAYSGQPRRARQDTASGPREGCRSCPDREQAGLGEGTGGAELPLGAFRERAGRPSAAGSAAEFAWAGCQARAAVPGEGVQGRRVSRLRRGEIPGSGEGAAWPTSGGCLGRQGDGERGGVREVEKAAGLLRTSCQVRLSRVLAGPS